MTDSTGINERLVTLEPMASSDGLRDPVVGGASSEEVNLPSGRPQGDTLETASARSIRGACALVAISNEPPPRLVVDPPLPKALARGRVFIQYRTENIRLLPVFGEGALDVSPRVGHLHLTVDDLPWHFVDASGETLVLVGLPPGRHHVTFELADPAHRVIGREVVEFEVPERFSTD